MIRSREDPSIHAENRFRIPFWWGATVESSLLLLAILGGWLLPVPIMAGWKLNWLALGLGMAAVAPMLLVLWWMAVSRIPSLQRIRQFLDQILRPALHDWQVTQLLSISVLAGVAEEMLFRGLAQGWLSGIMGPWPALLIASALFGVCHWITPAYAVMAGVMGAYLGVLWICSGNLLVPIIAHGLYDFVALLWLLRLQPTPTVTAGAPRCCENAPDNHGRPAPTDPH